MSRILLRMVALAVCATVAGCPGDDPAPAGDTQVNGSTDVSADSGQDAGTGDVTGPLDVDVDEVERIPGLNGPVSIVTDDKGIPHVKATSLEDLAYGLAWVHCRDRLPQMELARRSANGTLAELLGGLDDGLIKDDIIARVYGFRRVAQQMYDALDPMGEARRMLDAYAEGVNAYLAKLRDGTIELGAPFPLFLPIAVLNDWSPIDSLSIGRLQAFELGFDSDHEVGLTERYEAIVAGFDAGDADPLIAGRAGYLGDVYGWSPPDQTLQYQEWTPPAGGPGMLRVPRTSDRKRPKLPKHLAQRAARFNRSGTYRVTAPGQKGASNSWVVSGDLTTSGNPLVCNDPHLSLDNPPLFYFVHLLLDDGVPGGPMDVIGGNFPGIPGFLIGHNRRVAWSLTTSADDRSDAYLETFDAGNGSPTVLVDGAPQPVTVITETVKVGNLGELVDEIEVPIMFTPQNRVLVPDASPTGVAPMESGPQLSYAWVGFEPTQEITTILGALKVASAAAMVDLLDEFTVANQNVLGADIDGTIFGVSPGAVPTRQAGAMAWDPDTNPTGAAPWWVLPGDGGADWTGLTPQDAGPREIDPARGWIVTANNDHFGQTLDDNPLNESVYIGYEYAMGWRAGRITELIDGTGPDSPVAGGAKFDFDAMVAIHTDVYSNLGSRLMPLMMAELNKMEEEFEAPGTHPELMGWDVTYANAKAAFDEAVSYLSGWSFYARSGVTEGNANPSAEEKFDAVATALWNVWLVKATQASLDDEATHLGYGRESNNFRQRGFVRILENVPGDVKTLDAVTGDSLLWDDIATTDVQEGRTEILVKAFFDALTEAPSLFADGTPMAQWYWGDLHRLTLDSLLPIPGGSLDLPGPKDDNFEVGFARPGDQGAVNVCNPGLTDFNFRCGSGPMLRMCTELDPAGVRSYWMIPGGQVYVPASPHYRDWLDDWLSGTPHYWATTEEEALQRAEHHLVLSP